MARGEDKIRDLLAKAGITPNGSNSWDIQVHNPAFYSRVLAGGTLAFGESYMDGWWDAPDMSEMIAHVARAGLSSRSLVSLSLILNVTKALLLNQQSIFRAREVGKKHYDVGNDLYKAMLDKRMTYTCGYWENTKTLDDAQEAKLDLVCKKIGLKKGDRVLDIGGGWGSFAGYAAEKYGASVVATTISKEQAELGRERVKGLPVEIRLQDYRETSDGPYDHIVSLGMFEHVGLKNYATYFKKARELLKDDGLFLLHTIAGNQSTMSGEPWTNKYIFPNSMLPSVKQIGGAFEKYFVMEDWHNFSADYDKTLQQWFKNFDTHWPQLKAQYDERFYRMWKFYLQCAAGNFRGRALQLWQIVLSPHGVPGGYQSVR